MYITFFAGSPWAKMVFFPRNCSTFLPRPAESRNNFTLKAGLLVFAFWGGRRTLADTRRGEDDSMVKNNMQPDPADCSILHSPCRPALRDFSHGNCDSGAELSWFESKAPSQI